MAEINDQLEFDHERTLSASIPDVPLHGEPKAADWASRVVDKIDLLVTARGDVLKGAAERHDYRLIQFA